MMTHRAVVTELVVIGVLCLPATARAQESDAQSQAKEHFLAGKALVEQGALEDAIVEFEKSYELNPVPVVLYNIAICHDDLKHYVEAHEYYSRYLAESSDLTEERVAEVKTRLDFIGGFLGSLKIVGALEGAEVWIDGLLAGRVPLADLVLATGEHALILETPDHPDLEDVFTIAARAETVIVVSFPEEVHSQPLVVEMATTGAEDGAQAGEGESEQQQDAPGAEAGAPAKAKSGKLARTPFIAVASVTGALFVAAVVTGALALSTHREFETKYFEDRSEWKPLKDRSDALAKATDALVGIGAAAAVAAVLLGVFTDWKKDREKHPAKEGAQLATSPFLTPGGAGILLAGVF